MKKIFLISLIFYIILPNLAKSETELKGRILLQVEDKGRAWYVSLADGKRYSLGRPDDAFNLMQKLSLGISNKNLAKIPVGFSADNYPDLDADGLGDSLEDALGTDKNNKDTDADGYGDKTELTGGYDPLGSGKLPLDENFTEKNSGKIFLQVEKNGQAWYLEPLSQKRYFLGRPNDAFNIMKTFGLGITDNDLKKIPIGSLPDITAPPINPIATSTDNVLQPAAAAIRAVDTQKTLTYFTSNLHKSIEYSLENMSKENLLLLANILSASALKSSTETKKTYSNEVYFQDKKHIVYFYVEKQPDGKWLLTNL